MPPSPLRIVLAAVAAALVIGTAGCDLTGLPAGAASSAPPVSPGTGLESLVVATPHTMAGYSRDRFPHWIDQGGGCDTRDVVLKRDGKNVVATATCKITSGTWFSQYDEVTFTDPLKLDVDHMVPLANAWRSGAATWTDQKRSEFANDLGRPQLISVSASSNRSKGDQDPSQWRPKNTGFWCEYAQRWIAVKQYWQLTVTAKEKSKLAEMLGTCT